MDCKFKQEVLDSNHKNNVENTGRHMEELFVTAWDKIPEVKQESIEIKEENIKTEENLELNTITGFTDNDEFQIPVEKDENELKVTAPGLSRVSNDCEATGLGPSNLKTSVFPGTKKKKLCERNLTASVCETLQYLSEISEDGDCSNSEFENEMGEEYAPRIMQDYRKTQAFSRRNVSVPRVIKRELEGSDASEEDFQDNVIDFEPCSSKNGLQSDRMVRRKNKLCQRERNSLLDDLASETEDLSSDEDELDVYQSPQDETVYSDNASSSEDAYTEEDSSIVTVAGAKSKSKRPCIYNWTARQFNPPPCDFSYVDPMTQDKQHYSPYMYFNEYFPNSLFEDIAKQTNLYSVQKTGKSINTTAKEIRVLFGIHVEMGTLSFPRLNMYWAPTRRVPLIADSMTMNRLCSLRNNLHFVNNLDENINKENKLWKVAPVLENVKKACNGLSLEEHNCVDEMVIPFKGKINMKRYTGIKNRPKPSEIKVFFLCGSSGIVYNFIVHQGKSSASPGSLKDRFRLGASTVLELAEVIPNNHNFKMYFGDFFTSIQLITELRKRSIFSAGTIRSSRDGKCPLKSDEELKEEGIGAIDEIREKSEDVVVVKWLDNSTVQLASSFVGKEPITEVNRYSKEEKKQVVVSCPQVVKCYNSHIGGVDKMDFLVSLYRNKIRSKKWTLRVVFHFVDVAICNSWLEYKRKTNEPQKTRMDLLGFRNYIAETLIKHDLGVQRTSGSPSSNNATSSTHRQMPRQRPVADVRFDGLNHWPEPKDMTTAAKCKLEGCHGRTRIMCKKCDVQLCLTKERNCFEKFHVK